MAFEFFANFELAFQKLASFIKQGIKDELDRAGLIQAFEFTFEQAWKSIQKKAKSEGVIVNSPKQALIWAMRQAWIAPDQEDLWLAMLDDRNLASHTYREETSAQVADHILKSYHALLGGLLAAMKKPSD